MPTRSELAKLLYSAVDFGIPFHEFVKAIADWQLIPVYLEKNPVGVIMQRANEVHIATLPEAKGRWFKRSQAREVLTPLVKQYGLVSTKVRKSNRAGQAFCRRLGFKQVGETEEVIEYVLSKIRHT